MADAVVPSPGSVAPEDKTGTAKNDTGQPGQQGDAGQQPQYVKLEDFTRVEFELQQVTQQLKNFSAAQRLAEKQREKDKQIQDTVSQEKLTLQSLKAEMDAKLEAKEKAIQVKQISTAISDAAREHGITDKRMLRLFKLEMENLFLQPDSKEKITIGTNDEVVHLDGLDRATPLSDFVKKWLATPDGQTYLPAQVTPGPVGQRVNQGQATRGATMQSALESMTAEYMQSHPAEARAAAQQAAKQLLANPQG